MTDTHDDNGRTPGSESVETGTEQNGWRRYLRFLSMIAVAMVAMYGLMYVNSMELSHIHWSETRAYMTLLMGAAMALIMLGFMLGRYRNAKLNLGIVLISLVFGGLAIHLVRSQTTVQDRSFMKAMIPHHSIAILTSERSETRDLRVCELQVAIIEAQRREIAEMEWLIDDIDENGPAETVADARARSVPDFEGTSRRSCPGDGRP